MNEDAVIESPGREAGSLLRAVAASAVIPSLVLAVLRPEPAGAPDRLSAGWLLALAGRLAEEVGTLVRVADRARRRVTTFAVDGRVRFASAADRAAFADELADAVTALIAKYHDDTATGGRDHRLVVALHPSVTTDTTTNT